MYSSSCAAYYFDCERFIINSAQRIHIIITPVHRRLCSPKVVLAEMRISLTTKPGAPSNIMTDDMAYPSYPWFLLAALLTAAAAMSVPSDQASDRAAQPLGSHAGPDPGLPGIIVPFPRRDVFSSWSSLVRTCTCTACSPQTIANAVQGALPGQSDLPGRWILRGGAVHDSRRICIGRGPVANIYPRCRDAHSGLDGQAKNSCDNQTLVLAVNVTWTFAVPHQHKPT